MSNEEKPITSRRERRLAQAGLAATGQESRLTPAQAEAEARAKAAAQAEAARAHAAGVSAAHAAAEAQARPFGEGTQPSAQPSEPLTDRTAAVRARRALDVPADSVRQGGPERSSQARARDRAAQRMLRELAEKEQAFQGSSSPYPSRRALRERETGKVPRVTPQEASSEAPHAPESEAPRGPLPGPGARQPAASPAQPQPQAQPQARVPVPGVDPAPPTAMQGIVPQGLTVTPALGPETGSFRKLSHEQIAAARELLKEQAKNQAAMLEGQRGGDGTDVDPEVLAEQVRMAERAAILNRRAQAKQRLAEESRRETAAPARKAPTPTATDNLAMVTPLEFVNVPGVPHPVMKPPTTTHVPITTGQTDRQQRRPAERRAPAELPEGAPVSARSAHGLTPLDAAQSGARRAERERLILLGIGAVGILALVVAIVIIVLGSS